MVVHSDGGVEDQWVIGTESHPVPRCPPNGTVFERHHNRLQRNPHDLPMQGRSGPSTSIPIARIGGYSSTSLYSTRFDVACVVAGAPPLRTSSDRRISRSTTSSCTIDRSRSLKSNARCS